jgi:hypothetical protein
VKNREGQRAQPAGVLTANYAEIGVRALRAVPPRRAGFPLAALVWRASGASAIWSPRINEVNRLKLGNIAEIRLIAVPKNLV